MKMYTGSDLKSCACISALSQLRHNIERNVPAKCKASKDEALFMITKLKLANYQNSPYLCHLIKNTS